MRQSVIASVVGLLLLALSDVTLAETETFDSAASVAANGWVEFGSRENLFDFGFSPTNNAGGASGGEGGGLMARSQPHSYFGDISTTTRDLTNDLVASGQLKFQDMNFDGEFFFGWFDSTLAESDERAFLGISILEQRAEGWRMLASVNERDTPPTGESPPCNACDGELRFVPDNKALDFSLFWDADGGNSAGEGKLTLSLATVDGSETISSTAGPIASRTISTAFGPADAISGFNAFGVLSHSIAPRTDLGNFWFDDLFYTLDETLPSPGDFNGDGTIDTADFQILAANFGTGKFFADGDNNFDGQVTLQDFVEFRVLFQAQQGVAAAVPEPSSLAMMGLAGALLLITRRRKTGA